MRNNRGRVFQVLWLIGILLMSLSSMINCDSNGSNALAFEQSHMPLSANPNSLISVWNTAQTSTGSSNATQIKLPLYSGGNYSFTVNWGDTSESTISVWNQSEVLHTY